MSKSAISRKRIYDSDEEETSSSKRAKQYEVTSHAKTDDNGEPYWELSKSRRVAISEFSGKRMVNIREYYEKDGKTLPGKKGISLTLEQYTALINVLPQLEATLAEHGHSVPRPDYGSSNGTGTGRPSEGRGKESKKNHELTSDEDG